MDCVLMALESYRNELSGGCFGGMAYNMKASWIERLPKPQETLMLQQMARLNRHAGHSNPGR